MQSLVNMLGLMRLAREESVLVKPVPKKPTSFTYTITIYCPKCKQSKDYLEERDFNVGFSHETITGCLWGCYKVKLKK